MTEEKIKLPLVTKEDIYCLLSYILGIPLILISIWMFYLMMCAMLGGKI
jgi:hypothetical protein